MSLHELQDEKLAKEWSVRVESRMQASGCSSDEVEEASFIVYNLSKVVVDSLKKDPKVELPGSSAQFVLEKEHVELLLGLFNRSILNMIKKLRQTEMDSTTRKSILEQAAWEVLILAKIVLASSKLPGKAQGLLKGEEDMLIIMRKSTDEILKRHLPQGIVLRKKSEMTLAPSTGIVKFEGASRVALSLYKSFQEQLGAHGENDEGDY